MTKGYSAHRRVAGLGIAAVAVGVITLGAPPAAAEDLAPGVSCSDQGWCHNDTGTMYRITGQTTCSKAPHLQSFSSDIGRHTAVAIPVGCRGFGNHTISVEWQSATADS